MIVQMTFFSLANDHPPYARRRSDLSERDRLTFSAIERLVSV